MNSLQAMGTMFVAIGYALEQAIHDYTWCFARIWINEWIWPF